MILLHVEDGLEDILEVGDPTDAAPGPGSSVVRHHDLLLSRDEQRLLLVPDGLDQEPVLVNLGLLLLLLLLEMR